MLTGLVRKEIGIIIVAQNFSNILAVVLVTLAVVFLYFPQSAQENIEIVPKNKQ